MIKLSHEKRVERLDHYFKIVKRFILNEQSPTTGLLPASTAVNSHGDYTDAWVRDNVYAILPAWGLALAYRKVDNDKGRTYELEQSVVKCMRGLLFSMLRQSEKVEKFKYSQNPADALHAKYNVWTGGPVVGDHEWGHLQVDATSVFLLFLAQMTASGLEIIFTIDEVNFVQNLVYYIERAYRTPDYGIWERGHKGNSGKPELNASSIGMAKAALEAINGLNLFGEQGNKLSIIHVDPDAHNRNRAILLSFLPRESSSKETDSSLLSVIGFPAFAVGDEEIVTNTRNTIIEKLRGRYGFKRFLRDGHQSVLEDSNRLHYEPAELKIFEDIECEWPLFSCYMLLDALFREDDFAVREYLELTESVMVDKGDVMDLIPEVYYVPEHNVEAEKKNPHSQDRLPNDNVPLFWAQSLYILSKLVLEDLISVGEIDPVGRRLIKGVRPRPNTRHSAFNVQKREDLVVQMVLLSDSERLKNDLSTYGILTQTTREIEPVQVKTPDILVDLYKGLGVNKKLHLSGRPPRPMGALATSKIYRIAGQTFAFTPLILNKDDFYMSLDQTLLIDKIKNEIKFICNNWFMVGRPTMCLMLTENMMRGKHFSKMLELMAEFKRGSCEGVQIRVGRLQQLINCSCVEHLDFVRREQLDDAIAPEEATTSTILKLDRQGSVRFAMNQRMHFQRSRKSESADDELVERVHEPMDDSVLEASLSFDCRLSSGPEFMNMKEEGEFSSENLENIPTEDLLLSLEKSTNLCEQVNMLQSLLDRKGPDFVTGIGSAVTVRDLLDEVYNKAGELGLWSIVRQVASVTTKFVDSLAPSITEMLVRGKEVTIGTFGFQEYIISEPISPSLLVKVLYKHCSCADSREAVLQQELILNIASFITTVPAMFAGIMRIRLGWIIEAMKSELQLSMSLRDKAAANDKLMGLSPYEIKNLLKRVLTANIDIDEPETNTKLTNRRSFAPPEVDEFGSLQFDLRKSSADKDDQYPGKWIRRRHLDGSLNRVPENFYPRVWEVLSRCQGLAVYDTVLSAKPTVYDMTANEKGFAVLVESILEGIPMPEKRQLIVELLTVLSFAFDRCPNMMVDKTLHLDVLVERAKDIYMCGMPEDESASKRDSYKASFFDLPPAGDSGSTSWFLAEAICQDLSELLPGLKKEDICVIQ
eukprot:Nk52_evm62s230 gene=Nk52_evmTU62s230